MPTEQFDRKKSKRRKKKRSKYNEFERNRRKYIKKNLKQITEQF